MIFHLGFTVQLRATDTETFESDSVIRVGESRKNGKSQLWPWSSDTETEPSWLVPGQEESGLETKK